MVLQSVAENRSEHSSVEQHAPFPALQTASGAVQLSTFSSGIPSVFVQAVGDKSLHSPADVQQGTVAMVLQPACAHSASELRMVPAISSHSDCSLYMHSFHGVQQTTEGSLAQIVSVQAVPMPKKLPF